MTTPMKPSSTAVHRRGPTRSFSSGTDRIVMNSGAAKPIVMASASGISQTAAVKQSMSQTVRLARITCSSERLVPNWARPPER
jgi:hypothetical protein